MRNLSLSSRSRNCVVVRESSASEIFMTKGPRRRQTQHTSNHKIFSFLCLMDICITISSDCLMSRLVSLSSRASIEEQKERAFCTRDQITVGVRMRKLAHSSRSLSACFAYHVSSIDRIARLFNYISLSHPSRESKIESSRSRKKLEQSFRFCFVRSLLLGVVCTSESI